VAVTVSRPFVAELEAIREAVLERSGKVSILSRK
jgi:hypothetical protein